MPVPNDAAVSLSGKGKEEGVAADTQAVSQSCSANHFDCAYPSQLPPCTSLVCMQPSNAAAPGLAAPTDLDADD